MFKHTIFLLLAPYLLIVGSSCSKADSELRTRVCFTTQHHDVVIPNITIYVKYATTEFPGYEPLEQFNKVLVSDENGRVCVGDFPLGNHWFIAVGYDELIREQVIGNIMLRFDFRQLQADTVLYVGEE